MELLSPSKRQYEISKREMILSICWFLHWQVIPFDTKFPFFSEHCDFNHSDYVSMPPLVSKRAMLAIANLIIEPVNLKRNFWASSFSVCRVQLP